MKNVRIDAFLLISCFLYGQISAAGMSNIEVNWHVDDAADVLQAPAKVLTVYRTRTHAYPHLKSMFLLHADANTSKSATVLH